MLNIVIPMAGRGSRFAAVGYDLPKPLIPVKGEPMIKRVIDNLRPQSEYRFIFLCLAEHLNRYNIEEKLKGWEPGCEIVVVDEVTEGAACTVLLASLLIDTDEELMIANSDQLINIDINDYLKAAEAPDSDGMIMTMRANDPKWSFVRFNENGDVVEVVEKKVVSNVATVGIYNFCKGRDFVAAAHRMIAKNLRVNNEFYIAPVYNELLEEGKTLRCYDIGSDRNGMYGLGTPEDLEYFESLDTVLTITNELNEK